MESLPLDRLHKEQAAGGFDVILFKRSLYMKRPAATAVLKNAYGHVRPGGGIVIIHPEKQLGRYLFGFTPRVGGYTLYHLFNRTLSLTVQLLRGHRYSLYTREELLDLAAAVAGKERVERVPSQQVAFGVVAIQRPSTDQ